jgi:hypothetical protein
MIGPYGGRLTPGKSRNPTCKLWLYRKCSGLRLPPQSNFICRNTSDRELAFTRLVQLLEGNTLDDFADNFTGKGFVFGPYINFLGTGFIGIAAAMNTVRVKGEFNA